VKRQALNELGANEGEEGEADKLSAFTKYLAIRRQLDEDRLPARGRRRQEGVKDGKKASALCKQRKQKAVIIESRDRKGKGFHKKTWDFREGGNLL